MKPTLLILIISLSSIVFAGPVLQMNRAFEALLELVPYLADESEFKEKKNQNFVEQKVQDLRKAFADAKHATLLKEDLFAPSYQTVTESLDESLKSFRTGDKGYAHWRLREITAQCMDCHTRLPPSYASSFQNGQLTIDRSKVGDVYNLGITQMVVRRYVDAKESFTRSIQDRLIKKDITNIDLPFKQIVLIESKVLKQPENLIAFLETYQKNKMIPGELKSRIVVWIKDLQNWKDDSQVKSGLHTEKDVRAFLDKKLKPLSVEMLYDGSHDVDLLISSGLLSNYFFENPKSTLAPELSFWLGWIETYLKRENFFGSGELFLKQCVRRYPEHPMARLCLDTYKEFIEYQFTGSSGTNLPKDIKDEISQLESLVKKK